MQITSGKKKEKKKKDQIPVFELVAFILLSTVVFDIEHLKAFTSFTELKKCELAGNGTK